VDRSPLNGLASAPSRWFDARMIVTSAAMRELEAEAIRQGHDEARLMEAAAAGIVAVASRWFRAPGRCVVFAGKGNNGGDVLVAGRMLEERGWQVDAVPVYAADELSPVARERQHEFLAAGGRLREAIAPATADLVLDGLLGTGARGALRGPLGAAAEAIATLRAAGARVLSADLPSGLDPDSGEAPEGTVVADCTVAIGRAKMGLFSDEAGAFTGSIEVIALPGVPPAAPTGSETLFTRAELARLIPRPALDAHKGDCGRVGIVAGSVGFAGAAVLAASGALRAGAGLVTVFVPPDVYPVVASAAPPEAMVRPCTDPAGAASAASLDAIAVGPGLGFAHRESVLRLIAEFPGPAVIDADALTALASAPETLHRAVGARVLTPHPGEMARLFPCREGWSRLEWGTAWAADNPGVLLLKRPRTLIVARGMPAVHNTTGNPGMAAGGMGDVLTGILAALLGRGIAPREAAVLGAWLHGRSADLLVHRDGVSEEGLTASDVARGLGEALRDLRRPLKG